jgi:superfamily II DNA or RNA helicase
MKDRAQIQQEALDAIGDLRMSGLEVSMGVGKTKIALMHMAKNYTDIKKYLVVAPKISIFESWKAEMVKHNFEYLKDHITFSTYLSLTKQSLDYDVIYLDECHALKKNHNEWLKSYIRQGGYIVGMTGTYPVHSSSEKGKMCNFYCPKIYKYLIDEAIDDTILNNYEIIVHELELSNKPTIKKQGKYGDYMVSELKEYQYWTQKLEECVNQKNEYILRILRMKALQMFDSKLKYAKLLFNAQTEKTIVFANTIVQAEELCEHYYHSENPVFSTENLELFKTGKITKLSAVEQLNEGVNIPGLKVGIIMHSYSNNRKSLQKLGRLLRLNPSETATVHILCYENSVDKDWVNQALKTLDQSKIKWIKPMYYASISN